MNWSVGKIGTIYQKPAQAIGRSAPPIGCVLDLLGLPGGGNKIYDRSPYGNQGTITGAVWKRLPSGLWYLDFDGTDDYVNCGDVCNVGTGDFSLEVWVKPDSTASADILSKGQAHAGAGYVMPSYLLWIYGTKFRMKVRDADGEVECLANATLTAGAWCQLFGVADRDATLKFYINAVLQTDQPNISTIGSLDSTENLRIGNYSSTNYLPFGGLIALARVYRGIALSALEIQNHFQQEKHLFGVW